MAAKKPTANAGKTSDKTSGKKPARDTSRRGAAKPQSAPHAKPKATKGSAKKASVKSRSGATTKPHQATQAKKAAPETTTPARDVATTSVEPGPHDAIVQALRAFGLNYPEAHTKSPWPGHLDLAVRSKTFAYLSLDGEPLRIGCKLPHSCQAALSLPFAQPTPYGLGKSGWVTATFEANDTPPLEFLEAWLDESYRAVAPKTLVKKLPAHV